MTPNKRSLTQADVDFLVEEMKHHFATKSELEEKIKDFATREDLIAFKTEILGAINKKDENDAAHKMLHENIGEDVPKLQKQVQHPFKTFEIVDHTEVAVSI